APALSRRAVRGCRRRRVAADSRPARALREERRHRVPHVPHPRDRRSFVRSHRHHQSRPARGAGANRRAARMRRRRPDARGAMLRAGRRGSRGRAGARLALAMIRSLRAFTWLRWRLLVNAIRGGERRDRLERVSRTIAVMSPILLLVLSCGSFIAVSLLGFVAGQAAAGGLVDPVAIVLVMRIVVGGLLVLVVIMHILAPLQTMMASYNRLLLLPIPRASLHLVEVIANLTDPWITVMIPGLFTFAIGLAYGGRAGAGLLAAAAGVAMVFLLVSVAALVSFVLG